MKNNVFDETLERYRYLYDNYEDGLVVSTSGGKDSVVLLELAIMVAKELGRLPVKAFFLDQEVEWQSTVDYMRYLKTRRDEVDLDWYQIPFRLFNSTSHESDTSYLNCWDEGEKDKWMREKDSSSIHENTTGKDRFHAIMHHFDTHYAFVGDKPIQTVAHCIGMRASESLQRRKIIFSSTNEVIWGTGKKNAKRNGERVARFFPLYDWEDRDIWIAINNMGWQYNPIYDRMFSLGVPIQNMRVSALCHEHAATANLQTVQELEPQTYNKLVRRLEGISTATRLGEDFIQKKLPQAFVGWEEYRDYLLLHMVSEDHREGFQKTFKQDKWKYGNDDTIYQSSCQQRARQMQLNDYDMGLERQICNGLEGRYYKKYGKSHQHAKPRKKK